MARPRRFYIVLEMGRVTAIIEGSIAAKKKGAQPRSFPSRQSAEEFATWWEYDHQPAWLAPRDKALT